MEGGEDMINIYAQYSFSGYKILKLEKDSIIEVTGDNRMEIPDSAIKLFSHYGVKLVLAKDLTGYYQLFINDIPCRESDDMGRAKRCSILMCGTSMADAKILRKIAIMVLFELDQFGQFISSLFEIKDNLLFDYKRFDHFVNEAVNDESIREDRLRTAMFSKNNPIVVYTTTISTNALEPLYLSFGKRNLNSSFLLKWDEDSRCIKDRSVERIGFIHLIYRLLSKLTVIWKN